MTDTKFTAGNWWAKGRRDVVDDDGELICQLKRARLKNKWLEDSEMEANANLAAAAPRMYEALENLIDSISRLPVEDWVEQEPDGSPYLVGYVMQAQGEWDAVRSALESSKEILSQARGETDAT